MRKSRLMNSERSKEKELMDCGPAFYTSEEYADCLRILFKVNKLLGFFHSTVNLLKQFPDDVSLVDVGCGGGLFLLQLSQYYPNMTLLGIDVSEAAIQQAGNELRRLADLSLPTRLDSVFHGEDISHLEKMPNVEFQLQSQLTLDLATNSVDIVLITLVCHHIDDEDLPGFLQNAHQAARKAVIINDLHRHPLAYWFYKIMSPVLFRNRLITHDGLVSIKRSFTRSELQNLLKQANIANYEIKWCFPFRWRVILWKT